MKLLELIVKNVPREKIPRSVEFFAQNWKGKKEKVMCFLDKPHKGMIGWEGGWYLQKESLDVGKTSEDAATTIITREEIMRAYDLVEQGYTLWFGGECPVDDGVIVDVVIRNGGCEIGACQLYRWGYAGIETDIIAYKISIKKYDLTALPLPSIIERTSPSSPILCDLMRDISKSMPEMMAADMVELADYLIAQGWGKYE